MKFFNYQNILTLFILTTAIFINACKKEYTDKYNIIAGDTIRISNDNNIQNFSINEFSEDTTISASIKDDTIYIYWPSYKTLPDSAAPIIMISDSANITPASGNRIAFKSGITYTVTAQSGDKKEYHTKVVINQPIANIQISSGNLYKSDPSNNTLRLTGDYIIPDTNATKTYLVLQSNNDAINITSKITSISNTDVIFTLDNLLEITNGQYRVMITSGVRTATTPDTKYLIIKDAPLPNPTITWTTALSVKAGESFTLNGSNIASIDSVKILKSGALYHLNYTYTSTSITLTVPAGTPVGAYTQMRFYSSEFSSSYAILSLPFPNRLNIIE